MRDASAAATGTPVPWVSQKATNRYSWLRWVVNCNLPFNFFAAHRELEKLESLTLLDARDLLDGLLEVQPTFSSYIASDVEIVHSPEFESAVVKVLSGKSGRLTVAQRAMLRPFLRAVTATEEAIELHVPSLAERILKRRKIEASSNRYVMLEAILERSYR
ncbi:Hypothetical protein PHPALM_12530 [Phytophthora palmivora]|uniref:Uncharacterized protein n=1 Tax=Phytophthora palmivora TaxID=4796 RepID=A0A2P4XZK5_9STRA|nr:Hypothetical protein PHPALM_12530 [Phytophthora palmivora]